MENAKNPILKQLKKLTKEKDIVLEVPPDPKLGDFAFPCFKLAKTMKKSPKAIAEDLKQRFKLVAPIKETKVIGPYLNFFIDKSDLAKDVINSKPKIKKEKKQTIVIEYPSPNTNKPLHLGHIRNMVLGKSIQNLLEVKGHDIKPVDLINDRGIHICKSMLAYKKFGKDKHPDKKADHFVGDYYVEFNKRSKKDPNLESEAQQTLIRWEEGDKETIALWKKMRNWCIQGIEETYKNLGVKHIKSYAESDYYYKGKEIVEEGVKKKIFKEHEGAIYAELEPYKMPDKVLLRPDGTSIYMTQDMYLAILKQKDFKFDRSIYVVATEQNLHFQQLFKILELLGYKWAKDCHHLSYGMVYLPEGKMKSREGTVVDADDIIQETIDLAKTEIEKRHKELSKEEINKRAAVVGIGALKFYMLKTERSRDITYDPKESIAFEGETGPYIQYTYARLNSVLRKTTKPKEKLDYKNWNEQEQNIITLLSNYTETIDEAVKRYNPATLARYLLDLCQSTNEFYHQHQILKAEQETKTARLQLITAIKETIKDGLKLLGIDVVEAM